MKGLIGFALAFAFAGSVSAGEVPVFDAPDPVQFAEYGGTAKEVQYRSMPPRWIVDDWHRLGVKVYTVLSPEAYESPARFRQRFGILVFRSQVDGVRFGGTDEERAFYASAMKAAESDVALLKRLDEVAWKAMESSDGAIRTAGRAEKIFLHVSANFESMPIKLVRREAVYRIRRLQQLLGEPPMAMPADIPDAPPKPFVPPRNARVVKVGGEYDAVRLYSNMTFRACARCFSFNVSDGRKIAKDTWPDVKCAFTVYIPGTNRNDWLAYNMSCDLMNRKSAAPGGKSAPRVSFYTLEPRFAAAAGKRFQTKSSLLHSRETPALNLGYSYEAPNMVAAGDEKGWCFQFSYDWPQLYGLAPYSCARSSAVETAGIYAKNLAEKFCWYVCQDGDWVRLEWHGLDVFRGIELRNFIRGYQDAVGAALGDWGYNDPLFCDAYVRPLVEKNAALLELLTKKVQANGYAAWTERDKIICQKAASNAVNLEFFECDLQEARIRYLDDLIAGREVKVPKSKKKPSAMTKRPTFEEEEEGMSLEDSEY